MNPLSDALHHLVSTDEAAFRAAHSGRGLDLEPRTRRARRVRAATRAGLVAASAAVLTVSAISVSAALRRDSTEPDPVAPPIPEGYERVVISLDHQHVYLAVDDPLYQAYGNTEGLPCGLPIEVPPPSEDPFSLTITSASANSAQPPLFADAVLSYTGSSEGAVSLGVSYWILVSDDRRVGVALGMAVMTLDEPLSLTAPFSVPMRGAVFPAGCIDETTGLIDFGLAGSSLLDPGHYDLVVITRVGWYPEGIIKLKASDLGYDASWFGDEWRNSAPCRDALDSAKRKQNGNAIECLPNLYYQQIPTVGDFAIVDVPQGFLDGPRNEWVVVSDPYPIELPLEGVQPTT